MVKTFYDDLTLITMELCINELLYDCWYKRKRKDYQGRVLVLLFVGSIIQSGENVKFPLVPFVFLLYY